MKKYSKYKTSYVIRYIKFFDSFSPAEKSCITVTGASIIEMLQVIQLLYFSTVSIILNILINPHDHRTYRK
jgi:hypothetical protein